MPGGGAARPGRHRRSSAPRTTSRWPPTTDGGWPASGRRPTCWSRSACGPGRGGGSTPAELAAATSTVVFEARRDNPALPAVPGRARWPRRSGRCGGSGPGCRTSRATTASRLTRDLDLGFAWAAYRWADGQSLDRVLAGAEQAGTELSGGDFVRWCRQLIDLLDQLAKVAEDPVATVAPPPSARSVGASSPWRSAADQRFGAPTVHGAVRHNSPARGRLPGHRPDGGASMTDPPHDDERGRHGRTAARPGSEPHPAGQPATSAAVRPRRTGSREPASRSSTGSRVPAAALRPGRREPATRDTGRSRTGSRPPAGPAALVGVPRASGQGSRPRSSATAVRHAGAALRPAVPGPPQKSKARPDRRSHRPAGVLLIVGVVAALVAMEVDRARPGGRGARRRRPVPGAAGAWPSSLTCAEEMQVDEARQLPVHRRHRRRRGGHPPDPPSPTRRRRPTPGPSLTGSPSVS